MEKNSKKAFPSPYGDREGMTLRDYFAGQALTGIAAKYGVCDRVGIAASLAYSLADEMMEQREK